MQAHRERKMIPMWLEEMMTGRRGDLPLHTVLNLSSSLCWGLWAPCELNLRKGEKKRGQDSSSRPHNPPNIYGHAGSFTSHRELVTTNLS